MIATAVVLTAVLAWVLASARLGRWSVTAPIVMAVAGYLLAAGRHRVVAINLQAADVRVLVELTLALVLFVDASAVGARWFRTQWRWPAQLLLVGLPLTMLLGWLVALGLLPGPSAVVLALVATTLSPTDAALGAAIMTDVRIGERVRQTINVESGLNDGLATPVVLVLIQAASSATQVGYRQAVACGVVELAVGAVVGLAFGRFGGRLLVLADRRGWSLEDEEPLGAFAIALLAYLVAVEVHGNGFVAAFVAGLAFGSTMVHRESQRLLEFTHRAGLLLGFAVWFLFGAALLPIALHALSWRVVAYAVLSLTVVRMLPVLLASLGVGAAPLDVLLVGWLGPRGLASIVFAILAVEGLEAGASWPVVQVVSLTVALSVLAHGLSAGPLARWYAARASGRAPTG